MVYNFFTIIAKWTKLAHLKASKLSMKSVILSNIGCFIYLVNVCKL